MSTFETNNHHSPDQSPKSFGGENLFIFVHPFSILIDGVGNYRFARDPNGVENYEWPISYSVPFSNHRFKCFGRRRTSYTECKLNMEHMF